MALLRSVEPAAISAVRVVECAKDVMSICVGLAEADATTFSTVPVATPKHSWLTKFRVAVMFSVNEPPVVNAPPPFLTTVTLVPVLVPP